MLGFLKKIWEMLIEWGEKIYEYRKKNNFSGMY